MRLPFTILVDGRRGGAGLDVSTWLHDVAGNSRPGGFVLSLAPRAGYKFEKTGPIRNDAVTIQWQWEPKGPSFGVDRLEKVAEPFQ